MKKAVALHVYGKVQGVWFRASTQMKAEELGIAGVVMNDTDGSVYIEAEGDPSALAKFVQWCSRGPSHADVTKVEQNEIAVKGLRAFSIRRW
ncbi:MAG: acylphosphatase [Saprospiraceae bacterium]|nr:acylphosphatase [Saprospiraceae bacterium]